MSMMVVELQQRLPRARIVYASATGVQNLESMAYANRMGLWGSGQSFATFVDFLESISKRGLGALEVRPRSIIVCLAITHGEHVLPPFYALF